HSMGGHGALTLALADPAAYATVSAWAPIVAPSQVPWGEKAFARYLGPDRARWAAHDTIALIDSGARFASPPLVDQGTADQFLERELRPELLAAAGARAGQPPVLRMPDGDAHAFFFIATFVAAHRAHQARGLGP